MTLSVFEGHSPIATCKSSQVGFFFVGYIFAPRLVGDWGGAHMLDNCSGDNVPGTVVWGQVFRRECLVGRGKCPNTCTSKSQLSCFWASKKWFISGTVLVCYYADERPPTHTHPNTRVVTATARTYHSPSHVNENSALTLYHDADI